MTRMQTLSGILLCFVLAWCFIVGASFGLMPYDDMRDAKLSVTVYIWAISCGFIFFFVCTIMIPVLIVLEAVEYLQNVEDVAENV